MFASPLAQFTDDLHGVPTRDVQRSFPAPKRLLDLARQKEIKMAIAVA